MRLRYEGVSPHIINAATDAGQVPSAPVCRQKDCKKEKSFWVFSVPATRPFCPSCPYYKSKDLSPMRQVPSCPTYTSSHMGAEHHGSPKSLSICWKSVVGHFCYIFLLVNLGDVISFFFMPVLAAVFICGWWTAVKDTCWCSVMYQLHPDDDTE